MSRQRFWPGETVRVTVSFTDVDGAPIAAAGVVIKARKPDGTTVTGSAIPVQGQTGSFYADFVTAQSGVWAVRGTCDSPTASAVEIDFAVSQSLVGVA